MKPRRAALIGIIFVVIAVFYWAFTQLVDPYLVDLTGVTLLLALGGATALMAYVLVVGLKQQS